MKSFGVRFYTANFANDVPNTAVADLLHGIYEASQQGKLSPSVSTILGFHPHWLHREFHAECGAYLVDGLKAWVRIRT